MKKWMRNFIEHFLQRLVSNLVAIFPTLELIMTFSAELIDEDFGTYHLFYLDYVHPIVTNYHDYNFIWFGILIGIFQVAIEGRLPVPYFVRYYFIQYATLNVAFTVVSLLFNYLVKNEIMATILGIFFIRTWVLFSAGLIVYCFVMVIFGKYATIPLITEATLFNLQRSRKRDN